MWTFLHMSAGAVKATDPSNVRETGLWAPDSGVHANYWVVPPVPQLAFKDGS